MKPKNHIRSLFLGIMVACIFLGSIELALRLFGYQPFWNSAGATFFESSAFQLAADGKEKIWRTNSANASIMLKQEFAAKKGNQFRIFAIGGSSAYGWGLSDPTRDSFLKQVAQNLEKEFPGRQFESINAGAIGFGSFRETILLKEIMNYEPDLILVYSGHNEFWEYPIYRDVFKTSSASMRILQRIEHLRLYGLMRDLFVKFNAKSFRIPWLTQGSYEKFDEDKYKEVKERYDKNIREMIAVIKKSGTHAIFSTLPSNLKVDPSIKTDWLWDASHHHSALSTQDLKIWDELYRHGQLAFEKGRYSDAVELYRKAIALDPTYARVYHDLGRSLEKLEAWDAAREAYWNHIDFSRRLITRDLNEILSKVCREEGIPLVDGRALFESKAIHQLTGYDLFIDSMHPNQAGHQILAEGYLQKIKENRWIGSEKPN
jgi:lysophospholipase L1-like esterase